MSDIQLKKKWIKWYPKAIYLKNSQDTKLNLSNSNQFLEKDFCDASHQESLNKKNHNTESKVIDLIKTQSYQDGFNTGFAKAKQEDNLILKEKLNTFFLEFEKSISMFEKKLYPQILQTVLTVSSYIIGKKDNVDQSILMQYIKRIMNKEIMYLKKPNLIIHPNNKILTEKVFKDFLQIHQWNLIYDDSVDLNSYKIKSESGGVDATSNARWNELYRFICSEEY